MSMDSLNSTTKKSSLDTQRHYKPRNVSDRIALRLTKLLRFFADTFFAKRYGHRAVVLETVAGVPGMVGGMIRHMRSLRRLERDEGWIKVLLEEAQNERMHLMIFLEIAKPTWLERFLVLAAQGTFFIAFVILYSLSAKTAHRLVGFFEEEAVISYTEYLAEIDAGALENGPAPEIAIEYYDLDGSATLRDVIVAVRSDEMQHRDVNHDFASQLDN